MKQLNNFYKAFSTKPLMLLFFFTLLPTMASAQCPDNNHPHMIDLGLPSGTKWACCNVGASKPEDFGGYYAWGETEEKSSYTPQNYLDGKGESYFLGNDIAGTDYDVAHVKWRGSWVMPNEKQMNELTQVCVSEWTTENGVNGRRFTGPNGASIFLPAAGIYFYDILSEAGSASHYWQSLDFSNPDSHYKSLWFTSETLGVSSLSRYYGESVRPVAGGTSVNTCPDNHHPHMIDLGLPSGTKWACCNVGASKPEDYGGYYAWGETEEKDYYDWSTYEFLDTNGDAISNDLGDDISGTKYDVAHVKWGGDWRMPSKEDFDELQSNCIFSETQLGGVSGWECTGSNGNTIFLPSAGWKYESTWSSQGSLGEFHSSTICEDRNAVWNFWMASGNGIQWSRDSGCYGNTVRAVVAGSSTPSGIAIDATNFTDENFRNWVLDQDYGHDGVLTEDEIAGVTYIDVSEKNIASLKGVEYFTALKQLYCFRNQLTALDVSKNTALTYLSCSYNQLTSLDVSKNTALTELSCYLNQLSTLDISKNTALTKLSCYYNQLTSLDVSKNTALTELSCYLNQLSTLDISKNTALTELYCSNNQLTALDVTNNTALTTLFCFNNRLTALDVSQNTALESIYCNYNQLTSLDVSQNMALTKLYCAGNQISETEMGNLVESLPTNNGELYVKDLTYANEQNVITPTQVAAAKAKGWTVYAFDENVGDYGDWVEYDGDEPKEITPVEQGETIDIGTEIDASTNLDGNVVGDVYYCISSDSGSYDPEEGCLVVTKPTDDSAIDGKDIFGEDFKDNYAGFMFMVAPGKGSIKVEAQTIGNMVLKVKVGDNAPTQMEVNGKTKVSFSYDVSEPTMVFIYGSIAAAGAKGMMKAAGTDMLKIYGIEVTSTDGIEAIDNGQLTIDNSPVYNLNGQRVESSKLNVQSSKLPKGIYIQNGKKVLVK